MMKLVDIVRWRALLHVCLVVGLSLCASTVVEVSGGRSDGAIASINGRQISRREFESAASRTSVRTPEDRRALLNYLVDSELLVQRAVELGLLESHPRLRKLVVRRTIDAPDVPAQLGPESGRATESDEAAWLERRIAERRRMTPIEVAPDFR